MQIANILVSIGGDDTSIVPKYGVTPSEVAVLRAIHGDDAVSEIDITGTIDRPARIERARLVETYGRQEDGRFTAKAVEALFPGIAAPMFDTFAELELPEDMFAAIRRAPAPAKEGGETKAPKPAKGKKTPVVEPTPADGADDADDDADGITDMPPRDLMG